MKPTPEQISKLPRWAQEHIADIEQQRFVAIRALNEYQDSQTESPFRCRDFECTGEGKEQLKTRFVQTNKMEVHWAGVELTVLIRPNVQEIYLQWCATDDRIREIAFIPMAFGSARLKAKENMR